MKDKIIIGAIILTWVMFKCGEISTRESDDAAVGYLIPTAFTFLCLVIFFLWA